MFGLSTSRRFQDPQGADLPGPGSYDCSNNASLDVSTNLMGVGLASTSQRFSSQQDKGESL